jgi:hypothetical protein
MGKKVAILQSNYLPWKGYFDIINSVDEFIFHDDLQYTKNDWRNRNSIKTPRGKIWLTIPCGTNEKRLICSVELNDKTWQKRHWNLIRQNYVNSKYWKQYKDYFEGFFLGKEWNNLSDLNQTFITNISHELLGVKTVFKDSRDYNLQFSKSERVMELLKKTNASYYLSGPAAKSYLNPDVFKSEKIQLEWMDYSGYKEYNQLFPPFIHNVSIIDLIFNEGVNSKYFLKSFTK